MPPIVMMLPTAPEVGLKLAIFGRTVKLVVLVPDPPGLVTVILPVMAVVGTVALMELQETTTGAPADTPPKLTSVTESRAVPLMVTSVPVVPLLGVKLVM